MPLAERQFAIVWTVANDQLETILGLDDDTFLQQLQQQIGWRLGRMVRVGERQSYPLALVTASEQVRRSVVLLGNAAHSLHPVAGQGFNLALRDTAMLAQHLNQACVQQQHPGELSLLQAYVKQQQRDQRLTVTASDVLPSLFGSEQPWLAALRDGGLMALSAMPVARRLFTRHAMGIGHTAARVGVTAGDS